MLMPSTPTARFNSNGSSPSATLFHNLVSAQYSISRLIANRLDAVSWIEGCPSARVLVVSLERCPRGRLSIGVSIGDWRLEN